MKESYPTNIATTIITFIDDVIEKAEKDEEIDKTRQQVNELFLKHKLGTKASSASPVILNYKEIIKKFNDGTLNAFFDDLDQMADFRKPLVGLMQEEIFQDLRKRRPETDQDEEDKKKKERMPDSSQNHVTYSRADWSPLISSAADTSFVVFMGLFVTNGGFLALVILGIRYWNKTENVTRTDSENNGADKQAARIKEMIEQGARQNSKLSKNASDESDHDTESTKKATAIATAPLVPADYVYAEKPSNTVREPKVDYRSREIEVD